MHHVLILATLAAAQTSAAAPVSGAASAASRGGAGAVDPRPGSQAPTPSIVGGAAARAAAPEPRCPDGAGRSRPCGAVGTGTGTGG